MERWAGGEVLVFTVQLFTRVEKADVSAQVCLPSPLILCFIREAITAQVTGSLQHKYGDSIFDGISHKPKPESLK